MVGIGSNNSSTTTRSKTKEEHLSQHESLDRSRFPSCVIRIDHDRTQPGVSGCRLESRRQIVQKAIDNHFLLDTDYAFKWARHSYVRDVRRSQGEHALIGGGDVRVRANHRSNPAIEIPAERNFL